MKVIRVTNEFHISADSPVIEVGTKTEVVEEKTHPESGWLMYKVAAVPPLIIGHVRIHYWYDAKGFATLPDTSADEMQEQEREGIVNIETV